MCRSKVMKESRGSTSGSVAEGLWAGDPGKEGTVTRCKAYCWLLSVVTICLLTGADASVVDSMRLTRCKFLSLIKVK